MERRVGVTEPLLAGAERSEVGGRLGNDVVVELEDNSAGGLLGDRDVEEDVRLGGGGGEGSDGGFDGHGGCWKALENIDCHPPTSTPSQSLPSSILVLILF